MSFRKATLDPEKVAPEKLNVHETYNDVDTADGEALPRETSTSNIGESWASGPKNLRAWVSRLAEFNL